MNSKDEDLVQRCQRSGGRLGVVYEVDVVVLDERNEPALGLVVVVGADGERRGVGGSWAEDVAELLGGAVRAEPRLEDRKVGAVKTLNARLGVTHLCVARLRCGRRGEQRLVGRFRARKVLEWS